MCVGALTCLKQAPSWHDANARVHTYTHKLINEFIYIVVIQYTRINIICFIRYIGICLFHSKELNLHSEFYFCATFTYRLARNENSYTYVCVCVCVNVLAGINFHTVKYIYYINVYVCMLAPSWLCMRIPYEKLSLPLFLH